MRSPDHLKIKESCREAIQQIMAKSNLGNVECINFDDQGWVNVTARPDSLIDFAVEIAVLSGAIEKSKSSFWKQYYKGQST